MLKSNKKTINKPKSTKTQNTKTKKIPTGRNVAIGKLLKKGGAANVTSNTKLNMVIANQIYKDSKNKKSKVYSTNAYPYPFRNDGLHKTAILR